MFCQNYSVIFFFNLVNVFQINFFGKNLLIKKITMLNNQMIVEKKLSNIVLFSIKIKIQNFEST